MAKRKRAKRPLRRLVCLVAVAAACLIGWDQLRPLVVAQSEPIYESYTVETGDIQTSMSLSGSIDLRESEAFSASQSATVQEVYVEADQQVSPGDELMRLSSGEVLEAGIYGTVTELNVQKGDAVWPQMSLATVGNLDELRVTTSVDEYDVKTVQAGQSCSVTVVSLGLTFETEIDHVNRVSSSAGGVAGYTVTADIDAPEDVLPGMRATVTIPTQSVGGVNVLPVAALSFDEDAQSYVLMEDGQGGYRSVPVSTGLTDGVNVEITDGVEAGDVVFVQTGTRTVESALSLTAAYKALFGETTVINQRGGMDAASGGFPEGMEMPEGAQMPEGMELPEDAQMPEGMELPEGAQTSTDAQPSTDAETSEDAQPSESAQPSGTAQPSTDAQTSADAQTATGAQTPAGARPSGDMEMPQGMEAPEGANGGMSDAQ